ncbi:interleukin-12 subunit beta [Pangasianodon hypophthalmus]|uniref:interleukin-12 subunit beta n=1 Tax=Pangasianodon hypophthalmus TaxID=310915 RepID=UPI000EFE5180|nr:interleukin-12 subunit beta [Pangasianodon hypophthalmus]
MRASLSIITILCLCSMSMSALDMFPEKFVAGRKGGNVSLSCDKPTKKPVTWKLGDEDLDPMEGIIEIEGNTVRLHQLDVDLTGNYTCWSEGQEVDYTYVLLDMSDTITGSPVSCTAETFNCTSTISCTMSEKGFQYFRLRDERSDCCWLSPSAEGRFYLTHATNPFAEEAKPIVVIGEAVSTLQYYFETRHSFYVRDIIRPGCPRVSVLKTDNGSMLAVNPPVTWTLPLSYYPLEHEIEFQKRTNGEISSLFYTQPNNTDSSGGSVAIPTGTSKLRARCRDSLLLSQWSEWTAWQNVGKRRPKKGKKQKKKDKKKKGIRHKSR